MLLKLESFTSHIGQFCIIFLNYSQIQLFVLLHSRQEFVDLYVDYVFNKSVDEQFKCFYNGFHKVIGGRVLVSCFFGSC